MKAICKTIFILLFSLPGITLAEEDIIRFDNFNWGISFSDLPAQAESHYFRLEKKIVNQHLALWAASVKGADRYRLREEVRKECRLQLIYEGQLEGKPARITFFFTPLTKKLFQVTIGWKVDFPLEPLRKKLNKLHGSPREEFTSIGNYIWTGGETEVELQGGEDKITLSYSDLKLWKTFRKERKTIRQAGGKPSS